MTRQEAVERLKNIKSLVDKYDDVVALREAIKALEQEPCDDAISRQAVIDVLTKTSGIRGDALKALYDLPSVTPKQRTGRWEEIKSLWGGKWEMIDNYKCSVCGELEVSGNDYKFCPNCGAKMESEEQA